MGKIKFTALVESARGKLGNAVFSANRSGAYFRQNFLPLNPDTTKQGQTRSKFGQVASSWAALTEPQRAAWINYAKDFSQTDVMGDVVSLTGFQLYSKLNNSLLMAGAPMLSAPGGFPSFNVEPIFTEIETTRVDVTIPALDEGSYANVGYIFYATGPKSMGRNSVSDSEYRVIWSEPEIAGPGETGVMLLPYQQIFGTPVVGTKVFTKVEYVDTRTGWRSAPYKNMITVQL